VIECTIFIDGSLLLYCAGNFEHDLYYGGDPAQECWLLSGSSTDNPRGVGGPMVPINLGRNRYFPETLPAKSKSSVVATTKINTSLGPSGSPYRAGMRKISDGC